MFQSITEQKKLPCLNYFFDYFLRYAVAYGHFALRNGAMPVPMLQPNLCQSALGLHLISKEKKNKTMDIFEKYVLYVVVKDENLW